MIPHVDPRLNWRALEASDLEDLWALREQIESIDDPVIPGVEGLLGVDDLIASGDMTIGGWDNYGNLLAYGWNLVTDEESARVHLVGGIHPTHRHMGIGKSVIAWQEHAAVQWRDEFHPDEDLWIGCYADRAQPGLGKILGDSGFATERYFYDMQRELKHLPAVRDVDGVEFTSFTFDRSDEVRVLHNRCFAVPAGKRGLTPQAWLASLSGDTFKPEWSYLAVVDGGVIGYALSGVDVGDPSDEDRGPAGWTDRVGVDKDHRGRGISVALLSRTLRSMAADGCVSAGIGVDTVDPASPDSLQEVLGYEMRDGLELLSKVVPAGVR